MAYTKEQMASAAAVIDSGKGVNKKVKVSNASLSAGSYEGAMARREASGGRVGDGRYDKDAYVYRPETNTFYDTEAIQKAKDSFTNWMTAGKGANNKNWGYDMSDPEDVNRYYSGQISKKYEAGYGTDSFSQWLKENGLPQADYFDSKYYKDAYASVLADRVEKQKAKNFKKAVAREAWSTASDPMNITGDDIAAAAQRIQLSNPIYKDIELYNPKDSDSSYDSYLSPALAEQTAQAKEQKNRTGKLSLDDVMSDIARYQNRVNAKVEQAQEQQQEETVKTQNIINTAIADSGFSVEIDKRVGLARDSKLKEYNSNKQKKQTASDIAIAAMREAGYSNQDIQKAIRQDGRLSYSESTEGKANEAERIARRDSSDATSAKILNGMDSFTQGAVDKAKRLGNMGTSAQQGFSPISMMEGYGMSAQETQAVNNYVDTTRAILETQGYNGLEIDNALRRADLGEYIPTATARTNYATYTLQECGLTDEQIQQVLATYTEEDWKNVDKDMMASDYVENSMADQLANSIISMPIRAALSIACGAVGLVDMSAATISGRTELWKFTDELQDMSAWWTQFAHDRNHKVISTAADVGAEIMRMRATSLIGSVLTPAATTTSGSAAGTNFLFNFMQKNASRMPFVASSIGNYYLEAVNNGATPRMAALYATPAGLLEGYLESLEMGEVLQHSFGMNIVGKKIAASGLSANFKQFAITKGMPFINFALGTIGEGLEEAASYYGSSIARMATWDKGYEMDFSEMWDNAKGGLLIGGIMNGLSMGAHTQSYKYASEIYKGTGGNYAAYLDSFMSAMHMENMNDVQRQALIDKYNSGEINVSRDAAINAGVEIQTNAEVVAAKKQAVESAENDAAVKVENANNKVTQAEQRLASIDDPDPVKKGKKLTQAARELTSAKAAASQAASEGQKKVDTATADYKSEAAKAKRKNAANQQLVDEYHASKYCSDIEAETDIAVEAAVTAEDIASLESLLQSEKEKLAAMPYQNSKAAIRRKDRIAKLENQIASAKSSLNAAVSPAAVDPTANTNADANTAQNGIDNIKNGVAQTANEKYNNNRGDINGAENGSQAQAGGNAGISGQIVTVPYSGMAQGLPGMDGRADYRGIGSPVKDIIRQQGATPVDLRTASDPSSFYAAISEAKQGNPHGAFVTAHDVSEYGDMKMFLSDDNGVGVAVTKDGDIVSVFKNPNISKARKAVSSILLTAIDNGGVKLDNYNGELSRMYLAHGFIPVARTAFVDEYAPSDWNYERDGRPDIIFWMHNGNDVETVARNIGTQEMPDLKALPLMEYDEAAAYRDGLITKNASANSTLKDLGANTPTPAVQEAPQRAEQPVFRESRTATNTLSKVVGEDVLQQLREYEPNLLEHEVVSNSRSMELAAQKIEEKGIDGTEYELLDDNRVWENGDADASMSIITKRIEDGDMMSAAILAQNLAERETKAGQQIQELAKWTKTSAGMVTEAARNTQKALENAKPIVKDAVKSDTKAVKKANKKAQKEAADAAGKKLASDTAKSVDPAELLARKIVNATKPRTVEEADFVKRVVQDLFGVAKESPIVTPGEATDNTYSRVGKAYSDIGKYSDIWERAQEVVLQTMGDTPEVRQALAGYFTKENRPIVPESLLKKAYKKATDELGIDMSKLIRKTAGNVDAMRNELVNYLVSTTGVSEDGAVALAMEANRMFNNAEAQARAKYLRGVFRTKSFNEAATNALIDIESMVNAGALIDIEFADQIEAKLNEKLRKAIKESGYSIGDIVARGANGELEALAHFVTDVSGIDVNSADMETVLNAAIDTFGNVLDEFKTTQLDKLYEKLTAKQNNSTAADKRKPTEAEKAINNWILGLYNDSRFTDEIKAANGIPILTEADIQQIADYMQVYNTSTDERAAKEAAYRAGQIVASKQGDGSVKDKVRALSYMNMLLNFKTGIKNFSANLPMYVTETLKDVPGTLLDKVVSKYFGTGRTTNAFTTERFSGQLNSFGKGMKDAVLDMVHDVNTSPIPGRVEDVRANTFKSAAMNRLERLVGQYMQLGDRAWAQMAYDGRLGELKSLGYDITTEAAAKDAELYMLDRVFQNNSVLAQKAVNIRNSMGVLGDLILPFAQTPANIADKLLDYSPVGLARAIKQLGTETDIRTHTASSEFNQKLFVDRVSRSLTGTGILALGMAMAAKGLLTREPEDEATRSLTRQAGANAYAIKIGDTYHTINWSEPAGSLLIIGAALQSMFSADSAKDVLSIAWDAAIGGVNAFFNNSFLSSFADLLSSDTPADAIFDSLLSGSSRIVASQIGAIARATDKYERDTYDPNVLKRQVNYIISRVPGLRQTLPIKVGTDGQYQLASAGSSLGERILNTMFIPGYATRETDDPVNQELYRLYNEGYDEQVLPSANYKINGHKLTGEERREYQTIIGQISHSLAAQVINTKEYQQATDAEKAAMLEDGISEVWQHPDVKAFKKRFKK